MGERHTLTWRKPEENSAEFQEFPADEECKKAAGKAMNLLLQQDRTEKNLRERLYRAGYSERASEYAMQYVIHFGYVDDLRYARNYISCQKESHSRKELCYKLTDRGIAPDLIEEAFQDYEPEDERKALCRQLRKRLRGRSLSDLDYPARDKTMAYLVRKGYSLSMVRSAMKEWQEIEEQ